MGGRGSSSGVARTVAYDSWGKMIDNQQIRNKDGDVVGYISDRDVFVYEPDIHPVTKKEVLNDIDGWRGDDGYYGDQDTSVAFAYKDGSFVTGEDLNGKAYKKTGLIGASISTPDYEMVWGGNINRRTGEFQPWETWSEDGESGHTNSYSGYKATGIYRVRTKVTFDNPDGRGGYKPVYETIRQSTVVPLHGE